MSQGEDHRLALIRAFKKKKPEKDPAAAAKGDFKALLRLSLKELVTAGNMAIDPRLPGCLSAFAREIIQTDGGVPFRPSLRRLVGDCLEDNRRARECLDFIRDNRAEIDGNVYDLLFPLLATLLGEGESPSKPAGRLNATRSVE